MAALFEGILTGKNHKKVFTIEDTNSQLYISSGEERDEYEYNTTTLRLLLIRTRETATLFSSTFNKSGACLLSETCARRSPPIRGSVQKDALTVTSAAGEFSIRRAHTAPLESIRLRFVFLSSFFLFHFGGRLVFSSFFSRPTERKPKREEGVLRGDESNLIALRDASRGAVITRHVSEAETLVAPFFGHVALTRRFRFRFRRAFSSFVVVLVVERPPIRSNDGCLCRRHLLRARTSDAFFSQESSRRKTLKSLHSSTHTNKQTHKKRERELIKEVKKGEKNIMCTVDKVRRTKPRLLLFSSARARERSHLTQCNQIF